MSFCKNIRVCKGSEIVRMYCKANPDYHIAVREFVGAGVCIVGADPEDDSTVWIKDDKMAYNFEKPDGFSLVHKETMKAIRVSPAEGKQVLLADYNPAKLDETVLWYESKDKGGGFKTIYNNPKDPAIVLHALRCMKCDSMEPCPEGEARVRENTLVVVMPDKTGKDGVLEVAVNQLWKMVPAKGGCMG